MDKGMLIYFSMLLSALLIAITQTGCMQIVGADSVDLWGLKIQANAGTKVYAGVQQYDSAQETQAKRFKSEVKY